jgi:6-phosphogluconolactonase
VATEYYAYTGPGPIANVTDIGAISLGHFNSDTGVFTTPKLLVPDVVQPSFFAIAADGRHLYSVNEGPVQTLSAYEIDPATGNLTLLNTSATGGGDTCFVSLDKSGHFAAVASYGGSVAVIPIKADGSLGERTGFDAHRGKGPNERQTSAHAHCAVFDPTNKYLLSCDLGTDQIIVYKFNEKDGTITRNDPPFAATKPGFGPRHLMFSPNGKVAYVTNELDASVTVYAWDADKGTLTEIQNIASIPEKTPKPGIAPAELALSADGRFLYVSNRDRASTDPKAGNDSVGVFSISAIDGKLTRVQDVHVGKTPRYITLDPTGKWLVVAQQGAQSVMVFAVNAKTGMLSAMGDSVATAQPNCIAFVPLRDK